MSDVQNKQSPNPKGATHQTGPEVGPTVIDRRDELVSRVIDGEASEADWSALRAQAETDPTIWSDIAETQRQHEALCVAVDEVGRAADDVELPETGLLTAQERFDRRMNAVRAWGGWAAAAAVLLVWFTGLPAPSGSPPGGGPGNQSAGLVPASGEMTPEQALDRYITSGRQSGRVLAQVPERVVLETNPVRRGDTQGLEVVYLRQILEREVIDPSQVYRLGRDEFGRAALLPRREAGATRVSY